MGGLCLGSLGYSRVASARRHPLRMYALLEAAIGVIGLLVLVGVPVVGSAVLELGGAGNAGNRAARRRRRDLPASADAADGRHAAGAVALDRDDAARGVVAGFLLRAAIRRVRSSGACWPASTCSACHDLATATFVAVALNAAVAAAGVPGGVGQSVDPERVQATGIQADPDAQRLAEAGPAAAESLPSGAGRCTSPSRSRGSRRSGPR